MKDKLDVKVYSNRKLVNMEQLGELANEVTTEELINCFMESTIEQIPKGNNLSEVKQLKITMYQNELGFLELRATIHVKDGE